MKLENVRFRKHNIDHAGQPIQVNPSNDKPIDGTEPENLDGIVVCEITYPDGTVGVFPAHDPEPNESAAQNRVVTYADVYAPAYQAFKNGDQMAPRTDAERIERMQADLARKDALLQKHGIKDEPETGARKNVITGENPDDPSQRDQRFTGNVQGVIHPDNGTLGQSDPNAPQSSQSAPVTAKQDQQPLDDQKRLQAAQAEANKPNPAFQPGGAEFTGGKVLGGEANKVPAEGLNQPGPLEHV
jgi:hypothetical protein